MISITKPTLAQQAEIAIQTRLGDWFADPSLGSELHKVNQFKTSRENYQVLRKSLLDAVAHLPVEPETWQEGSEFRYRITEKDV
ncbi:hypothetical protein P0082_00885 [Candidatus Haliotispira prima]|uniref:Uncharacterized protein n=1 Tax=Candidatus Haliotispira prima TaxID=3034016 RepID=A0ABY8MJR9_9SPIO|nr:hypothetical protein P0082_00885 [Candidatus Haliotispira prima]